jgi:hypothetical protein
MDACLNSYSGGLARALHTIAVALLNIATCVHKLTGA